MNLTERQAKVLAAVVDYWATHGVSPSIRDIADACGFTSPNGAVCHLKALARKGAIEWLTGEDKARSRGIWPAGCRAKVRAVFGVANGGVT